MNQPLYTDLLNASLILVAQKNNKKKIQEHKDYIKLRNQIRDEMAALDDKPKGYGVRNGWGWFMLIFGGMGSLGITIATIVVSAMIRAGLDSAESQPFTPPMVAAILLSFYMLTTLGVILVISARKLLKKHRANDMILIEQLRQEDEVKNKADEATIAQLEADAVTLQKAANELLAFLPDTYRNTEAACYMLLAVKDGRADTLKEAMNLYEEQLHRWNMEKLAANSARMQQIHMESMQSAMREISDNQEQIQGQLSAIAGMQAMEMWRNA